MTARYLLGKASKRCWRYPTAGNDHCGAGVVSQFENRECLASEEYSPPRRGGEAARSMKKRRSHLFPRRRARSASAIARSRKSGQFGAIFSRRRSDHPVRSVKGGFAVFVAVGMEIALHPPHGSGCTD